MTPPGVFFLAIFQQTANLKQIYLYDSAICQQLQIEHHLLNPQSLSIYTHERRFTMPVTNTIELPKRRAAIEPTAIRHHAFCQVQGAGDYQHRGP